MKTLRKGSFVLLFGLFSIVSVRAQTADEVVSKYVDAIGGKTVLNGIKSMYVESLVEVSGMELSAVTYVLFGKGFKNESDFNGTKIVQVITDTSGWSINPPMGQTNAVAMTPEQVKTSQPQLQIGGALYNYAAKGYKIELIGKDTAMGGEYKIKLNGATALLETTYYINAKTYLIDKEVAKVSAQGQEIEVTSIFSDYKKTDAGLVVALTRQLTLPQYTLNFTNKK